MRTLDLDSILQGLKVVLERHEIEVLCIEHAPGNRSLEARLCQGAEISIDARFGLQLDRRIRSTLLLDYRVAVRWPRAEGMLRKINERPLLMFDTQEMVRTEKIDTENGYKILEARSQLYPIAMLSITRDKNWFSRPSPTKFTASVKWTPDLGPVD